MAGLAGNGCLDPGPNSLPLADGPFSPWRQRDELNPGELADFDNRPASPLDDLWLSGFADLYRAFAGVMSPAELDESELWQIAAMLGVDRREPGDDIDRLAQRVEAEKESLAQRAAKLPNAQREVEPGGMVDVTADIMRQMGISTK